MNRIKSITSADNPQFKQLKKLATFTRERRKTGQTILDGVHLLQAAAACAIGPSLIVVKEADALSGEIAACLKLFGDCRGISLPNALFEQLSPVETPSGILALIDVPVVASARPGSAVLLENIQDPGNLGTILRTTAAAGIETVYLSKGCAEAWSPKALRGAMGAHFKLAIVESQNLAEVADGFGKVIATRLDGRQSLYDLDLTGDVAFVFGNEGAGLSAELADKASHAIRIPMPGETESLNVAAATAVCLFERVRQLSLKG